MSTSTLTTTESAPVAADAQLVRAIGLWGATPAGHRECHRIRHLPDHRHHGAGASIHRAGAGGLGRGRPSRDGRRPHLCRDGIDVPAIGRALRLPERGVRNGVGLPVRLGLCAGDSHRQRRRGRRGVCGIFQLLFPVARHRPADRHLRHAVGRLDHQRRTTGGGRIDRGHHGYQLCRRSQRQPGKHGADNGKSGGPGGASPAGHCVHACRIRC